jgi:hypothetical protein
MSRGERGLISRLEEGDNEEILLTVSAMTLLMTGTACAEAETPVIDQRQMNQEQRIDQGIANGQLNERGANRRTRSRNMSTRTEERAKSERGDRDCILRAPSY